MKRLVWQGHVEFKEKGRKVRRLCRVYSVVGPMNHEVHYLSGHRWQVAAPGSQITAHAITKTGQYLGIL